MENNLARFDRQEAATYMITEFVVRWTDALEKRYKTFFVRTSKFNRTTVDVPPCWAQPAEKANGDLHWGMM